MRTSIALNGRLWLTKRMDFDLGDVGEFINDNPHIPIAAGLMAGQAINRNLQGARQDAAAIKRGLDAIQRQSNEVRRLAFEREQRERVLADNREFLFQVSGALDRTLAKGYSLSGYLDIEQLASDLKNRDLSTAAFADYKDKEVCAEVERKVAEARRLFVVQISAEIREQMCEIVRWDRLSFMVRRLGDLVQELRKNEEAQKAAHKRLAATKNQKAPSLGTVIKEIVAGNDLVLPSTVEMSAKRGTEISALKKNWMQIDTNLSQVATSILAIRGIAQDTLVFASSRDLTQEQRGEFIQACYKYIRDLLESLSLSPSTLPTIRRVRDFHSSGSFQSQVQQGQPPPLA